MPRKIRGDWFSLDSEEVALYHQTAGALPGVRVHRSPSGRVIGVDLHRNHFPCIPLDPQPMGSFGGSKLPTPYTLRSYQKEAVGFAQERSGCLLLLALGMGKTVASLSAAGFPAVVLVPTSAIQVWVNEATACGLKVQVIQGTGGRTAGLEKNVDLYIITYGSAHAWMGRFRTVTGGIELDTLIADEAQTLQKATLRWTQAFRSVRRHKAILLTATPIRNRLRSLWSLLDCANPQAWGSHFDFRVRYCGATRGDYGLVDGEPTNTEELALRLNEVCFRRTWDEEGMEQYRPVLHREKLDVAVSDADRQKVFDVAAQEAYDVFRGRDGLHDAGLRLSMMTRIRRQVGLLKAQWLVTSGTLANLLDQHNRLILWVWHKEVAEYLRTRMEEWGVDADCVTGDSYTKKRSETITEWQYGDHTQRRVLIASMGAMSTAVNLTTAKAAVFVEYDWAPLMVQQAECRHHRHGSRYSEVWAYYPQVEGTIDEHVAAVLMEKALGAEQAIGHDSQIEQMKLLVDACEYSSDYDVLTEAGRRLIDEANGR